MARVEYQRTMPGTATDVSPATQGQAVSILIRQNVGDPGGQTIEIFAVVAGGSVFIGSLTVSAYPGPSLYSDRLAGVAVAPGVIDYVATVRSAPALAASPTLDVALVCGDTSSGVPGVVALFP